MVSFSRDQMRNYYENICELFTYVCIVKIEVGEKTELQKCIADY